MLPQTLRDLVIEDRTRMNPDVAKGLVYARQKQIPAYIDSAWRVVAKNFPPGLVYKGCRPLTPQEEYRLTSKRGASRAAQIDLARCDLRYWVYFLEYNGEPAAPVYLQLPFLGQGGSIHLSGSRYIHCPVLSDPVISVNRTGAFAQLLQIKLVFNRVAYAFVTNSHTQSCEIHPVVWSRVWNGRPVIASGSSISGETTVAHYLFAKYGVTDTFKKYAQCDIHYGDESTINEENYPRDSYLICSSMGSHAPGRKKRKMSYSEPSLLKVAIRHDQSTPMVRALIAGLFYVTDRFSYRADCMALDELSMWRITLGLFIFGTDRGEGVLLADINEHISSMDLYVDEMVKFKIIKQGHAVEDIYDLFALLINKLDDWIIDNDVRGNCTYGKELTTLYRLLFDITRALVTFSYELKKCVRAPGGRTLTPRMIADASSVCRPGVIFALKSGSHNELAIDDGVGSCMPLHATRQFRAQDRTGGRVSEITTPANTIAASWLEAYSIACMTKAAPAGTTSGNPYITTVDDVIVPNPRTAHVVAEVAKMLAVATAG
jgi:hypothetical protein